MLSGQVFSGENKIITLSEIPNIYCSSADIEKMLMEKLNVSVQKISIAERAGHVDFLDIHLDQKYAPLRAQIEKLIYQRCE